MTLHVTIMEETARATRQKKKKKNLNLVFVFSFFESRQTPQPSHDPPCNYHGRHLSGKRGQKKKKKNLNLLFVFSFFRESTNPATEP
jgi:hypothetical protein